jgi:hypothetical protein
VPIPVARIASSKNDRFFLQSICSTNVDDCFLFYNPSSRFFKQEFVVSSPHLSPLTAGFGCSRQCVVVIRGKLPATGFRVREKLRGKGSNTRYGAGAFQPDNFGWGMALFPVFAVGGLA